MSHYPPGRVARDAFVLEHRAPRLSPDPWQPPDQLIEDELAPDGSIARVATVFLTGRECPWRCVMCDLWQHTTSNDTPTGAIAAQVRAARRSLDMGGTTAAPPHQPPDVYKLYNAGSFFDLRAVPEADYDDVAAALAGVRRVIVESHPALVGSRTTRFLASLHRYGTAGGRSPALEVAMGLETAHPDALERLNKQMTVDGFARAADNLTAWGIGLRAFLLISPPFVPGEEQDDWLLQSVAMAGAAGASAISMIPTRIGNGALEALARDRSFRPPTLADIERSFDLALSGPRPPGVRVFTDLWDLARFSDCPRCLDARRDRLRAMNLTQHVTPPVTCPSCSPRDAA